MLKRAADYKPYAWGPVGSQTGDISGDKVTGEYTSGTHDKACGRAVWTVDGRGWDHRQGRIRGTRQCWPWDGYLRHRGEGRRGCGLGGTCWSRDKLRRRVEIEPRAFPTEAECFVWMYAVDGVLGGTLGRDVWLSGGAGQMGVLGKRATGQDTVRIQILYSVRQRTKLRKGRGMLAGGKAISDFQFPTVIAQLVPTRPDQYRFVRPVREPNAGGSPQIIAMTAVASFFFFVSPGRGEPGRGRADRVSWRGEARRRACTGSKCVAEKGKSRRQ